MAFGYYSRSKVKKKVNKGVKKAVEPLQKRINELETQRLQNTPEEKENRIRSMIEKTKAERHAGEEEEEKKGREFLGRYFTPEHKRQLQEEAHRQIESGLQTKMRELKGIHGRQGITGRSGVAFGQRQELEREANEQRALANRDLNKLSADVDARKAAALYGIRTGGGLQANLDRQIAEDALNYERKEAEADEYRKKLSKSRLLNRL